jgi:hypothetical protein
MTGNVGLVLLVFSFVFFCIAVWAATQPDPLWKRVISLGLAALVAADIFGGLAALHYIH